MARPDTTKLRDLLDSARQVTILLPQTPHYDAVAASLACKISLDSSGKAVSVVCADPMTVEFNRLIAVDTVSTSFGNRNLVITFPGQTEAVDKVSYNLDRGELQLVITPKTGAPDLDHKKLKFVPGSAQTDLVLLIGVEQLLDLGPLYQDSKDMLKTTKVVSVTRDLPRENYTPYQVFDPEASSLSELMVHLIDSLNLHFHPDVATNLLAGMDKATQGFSSPTVSTSTFEMAAHLMRRGARRHHDTITAEGFPAGSIPTQPYSQPIQPTSTVSPSQTGWGTDSQVPVLDSAAPLAKEPPSDWYEPKIYRGPMLP